MLPLFTSSCPGWVCYAEKTQPAVLPLIATTKSAQQIIGSVLKALIRPLLNSREAGGAEVHQRPRDIFHVAVMPCYDKKLEASRLVGYRRRYDIVICT